MLRRVWSIVLLLSLALAGATPVQGLQSGTTYYVANDGDDGNDGLTPDTAFATIGKVNALDLQPGDSVLFTCGDAWRAEMLIITRSGAAGEPIVFGSYPADCADQPLLSGAQPISGWINHSGYIYVADLSAGENADRFGFGVNQLFRGGQRLPMGRWPNLDAGDAGYSTIDAQPAGNQIADNELPAGDWAGAIAHVKGMRWYILNRQVSDRAGQTLTLGANADCWDGCTGWGYFLNNHFNTLDREGEWYYDAASHHIYLYTTGGIPPDGQVEGSVVLMDDDRSWGGITLGEDLWDAVSYIIVENLAVRGWFRHGIATPTNLHPYENHDVVLRNNTISDVDGIGINLATWVWDAGDGRPDGWRGGHNHTVSGSVIERANHMGINTYGRDSVFRNNVIRDVGRIENLGAAGMGCGYDAGEGQCTEDGDGLRIKVDEAADSGNNNTVVGNHLERIAYNGMDVFGHHNSFQNNLIEQACYAKGDCGGVRTFGSGDLSSTPVHDLLFDHNLILDTIGNTDGCNSTYKSLFGFGLYIDHYSRDVTITGNTIISSTVHGILYQDSTGSVTDNTLYNNSRTWEYGAQLHVGEAPSYVSQHSGNVLYGLTESAWTLYLNDVGRLLASDNNYFFQPYVEKQISVGGWSGRRTLEEWQAYSGLDGNSKKNWFTQASGEEPRSRIFYNPTESALEVDLGSRQYLDLEQNEVLGSIILQPFTSRILVDNGEAPLTLISMSPTMWGVDEATNFTLTLRGAGFTEYSVVRWGGADRPTSFASASQLTATIYTADVSAAAEIPVTVYDPAPEPGGTETAPLTFYVIESVCRTYVPVVLK